MTSRFAAQWMIWYAIALHFVWGLALLSSDAPLGVTAIASIVNLGIVSSAAAGLVYCLLSLTALVGVFIPKNTKETGIAALLFLVPQTTALWLAAYGAATAMATGMFADGVIRPHSFLIADQAPAVLAAIGHTAAMIDLYIHRKK